MVYTPLLFALKKHIHILPKLALLVQEIAWAHNIIIIKKLC
jgi:hypothetical protein